MKKIIYVLFMFLFILTSCSNNNSSSNNLINSSKNENSSTTIENKVYQKDEEGFFILEDDYFKNTSIDDDKKASKVRFVENIDDSLKYNQLKMYIGDKEVPIYNCKTNMSQTWNGEAPSRMNNSVVLIELEGKVEIKLQANFAFLDECVIRPLAANIVPKIDNIHLNNPYS